jgi:hypothetical protein
LARCSDCWATCAGGAWALSSLARCSGCWAICVGGAEGVVDVDMRVLTNFSAE